MPTTEGLWRTGHYRYLRAELHLATSYKLVIWNPTTNLKLSFNSGTNARIVRASYRSIVS